MADKYIYAVARIRALEMTLMSQGHRTARGHGFLQEGGSVHHREGLGR